MIRGGQRRKQRQRALMCLVSNLLVPDPGVSDHKAISMEPPPLNKPNRQISFRNIKNINPVPRLLTSSVSRCQPPSVTESVDLYSSSLSPLLDRHAPVQPRTVPFPRSAPRYTTLVTPSSFYQPYIISSNLSPLHSDNTQQPCNSFISFLTTKGDNVRPFYFALHF
ncbi:unnamed protein product [Boreogadus saida]